MLLVSISQKHVACMCFRVSSVFHMLSLSVRQRNRAVYVVADSGRG